MGEDLPPVKSMMAERRSCWAHSPRSCPRACGWAGWWRRTTSWTRSSSPSRPPTCTPTTSSSGWCTGTWPITTWTPTSGRSRRSTVSSATIWSQPSRHISPQGVQCTKPEGGMFLWVTLPEGVSSVELFDLAIKEKVAFVPGKAFYADGSGDNTLRLNYTNSCPEAHRRRHRAAGQCHQATNGGESLCRPISD